ncbi:MAG TPA: hypothetical protein VF528_12715 [Pyrinomonadaceae bacterium]
MEQASTLVTEGDNKGRSLFRARQILTAFSFKMYVASRLLLAPGRVDDSFRVIVHAENVFPQTVKIPRWQETRSRKISGGFQDGKTR